MRLVDPFHFVRHASPFAHPTTARSLVNDPAHDADRAGSGPTGAAPDVHRWAPATDVREESERFVITADIPGVAPEALAVTTNDGVLEIRGRRGADGTDPQLSGGHHRVERPRGEFVRRFSLPDTADVDRIAATGRHGVLEVVVPKRTELAPRRIQVAA